jgi:hypothetical protein
MRAAVVDDAAIGIDFTRLMDREKIGEGSRCPFARAETSVSTRVASRISDSCLGERRRRRVLDIGRRHSDRWRIRGVRAIQDPSHAARVTGDLGTRHRSDPGQDHAIAHGAQDSSSSSRVHSPSELRLHPVPLAVLGPFRTARAPPRRAALRINQPWQRHTRSVLHAACFGRRVRAKLTHPCVGLATL